MTDLQKHPVVFNHSCMHCTRPLNPNSLVWSVGAPFHMIIHKECAPYFNYDNGYPHPQPFQHYDRKSNHNYNKPNDEKTLSVFNSGVCRN